MIIGTGRIEHRFGFDQLFGFAFQAIHRHRSRSATHNHFLRQDLVGLAEQHIEAVDDFFLSGIVAFRLVGNATGKHGNFSLHTLLRKRRCFEKSLG